MQKKNLTKSDVYIPKLVFHWSFVWVSVWLVGLIMGMRKENELWNGRKVHTKHCTHKINNNNISSSTNRWEHFKIWRKEELFEIHIQIMDYNRQRIRSLSCRSKFIACLFVYRCCENYRFQKLSEGMHTGSSSRRHITNVCLPMQNV